MNSIDQETLERWVDLDSENALDTDERLLADVGFGELGEGSARLQAARGRTEKLLAMFDESRIQVRSGFTDDVMDGLQSFGWDSPDELEPLLNESRIRVRTGFTEEVMENLPIPEWGPDASLEKLIAASKIPVREGFTAQVMASLPRPIVVGQSAARAGWLPPLAVMACCALAAVLLTTFGVSTDDSPAFGLVATLADFLHVSVLAGAGLLFVSWQGVGLGLEEALGSSGLQLVAFGALVMFLNLLLVSLIRRRPRSKAAVKGRRD